MRGFRISIIGLAIVTLFAALGVRLVDLQVLQGARLASAADANKVRTVYIEAPRGRILDRNGEVLVGNREVDVLTIDRGEASDNEELLRRLADVLHVSDKEIVARINDPRRSSYRRGVVASEVDKSVLATIRERAVEFPGVAAETHMERWYPSGTLGAHVLGYVGEINKEELAKNSKRGYQLGDEIGKTGIEQAFEERLRGRAGVEKIEVNSAGVAIRVLERTPPVSGQDVKTTLDLDIQKTAELALSDGLKLARNGGVPGAVEITPAPAGSVVAMDPNDGAVRAMASFPTFDPALFADGIAEAEYKRLTDPANHLPLTNRAIAGQYAPGSTFKLITALAALESGLITPNSTIIDRGTFTLGNRSYRNAQGAVYGTVDLRRSLSVSSDVFYYNLGAQFWDRRAKLGDPMQSLARQFHLGQLTGIEIAGENPGRIPDPKQRADAHDRNPRAFPEGNWFGGDNVNVAIGQGDTLETPLQLALQYSTFANGGTIYKPRLVDSALMADGTVAQSFDKAELGKVDLPQSRRVPVQEGLIGAINSNSGTAGAAFKGFDLVAYPIAGKTGTAQVNGKADSALFAGYGPVGNASLSVSVVLEQAGFGGAVAAPVARRVFATAAGQDSAVVTLGSGID